MSDMPEQKQEKNKRKQLTPSELAVFCAQMAMILKAGIVAAEGVAVMAADAPNPEGRAILRDVSGAMETGGAFADALETAACFPSYMTDMARVGERAGKLEEVLTSLTGYYEREEALRRNLRGAVTYPLVMITMMCLVIAVLLIKVLPVFNEMFLQMEREMTGFSLMLLRGGQWLGVWWPAALGLIVAAILLFVVLGRSAGGKRALNRFWSRLIFTRSLMAHIASSRFASAMALMLQSGMDTEEALDMTGRVVGQDTLREKIRVCQTEIAGGRSLAEVLEEQRIFPGLYAKMVTVGFKTGTVDEVMSKLADRLDAETQTSLNRLVAMIEPTLVVILSVLVGAILLSVMLPLADIMSTLGA
ncbi:MAG: type II secretion system F family protein [Gracilibacteraceae bacterium]|jgi:type IV pilus assembly protein PilC|nr:type II secretion system F family protein [Gracilibacteraceae bacterium]